MQYTLTLANGYEIAGLSKNGDNFVSHQKIDENIFKNNLSIMKISDENKNELILHDVELVQQMEWEDGTWYLAFRENPANEKAITD